jgi:predicted XRE-type DNA-binding protein
MPKCSTTGKDKGDKAWVESSGNVFKDIGFGDEEAANLVARCTLMLQIRNIIEENGWTQEQAAKALKVKQPRIAEIFGMKTQCFSVDLLLKYLARLGKRVEMTVQTSAKLPNQLSA